MLILTYIIEPLGIGFMLIPTIEHLSIMRRISIETTPYISLESSEIFSTDIPPNITKIWIIATINRAEDREFERPISPPHREQIAYSDMPLGYISLTLIIVVFRGL